MSCQWSPKKVRVWQMIRDSFRKEAKLPALQKACPKKPPRRSKFPTVHFFGKFLLSSNFHHFGPFSERRIIHEKFYVNLYLTEVDPCVSDLIHFIFRSNYFHEQLFILYTLVDVRGSNLVRLTWITIVNQFSWWNIKN